MTDDPMIAALLRERAGYEQRGLADRVAAVDEQLALRGHAPPAEQTEQQTEKPEEKEQPKPPADDKPRDRRAPKKERTS